MTKHFHTIEIAFVGFLGAVVGINATLFVAGKLSKSDKPLVSKIGRAAAGAVTFGRRA